MTLIQRNYYKGYDLRKFREGIDCKTDHCGAISPSIRIELEKALININNVPLLIHKLGNPQFSYLDIDKNGQYDGKVLTVNIGAEQNINEQDADYYKFIKYPKHNIQVSLAIPSPVITCTQRWILTQNYLWTSNSYQKHIKEMIQFREPILQS